jgi:hypothetical protein
MGAEIRKAPLIGPMDEREAQRQAIQDREHAISNMIRVSFFPPYCLFNRAVLTSGEREQDALRRNEYGPRISPHFGDSPFLGIVGLRVESFESTTTSRMVSNRQ